MRPAQPPVVEIDQRARLQEVQNEFQHLSRRLQDVAVDGAERHRSGIDAIVFAGFADQAIAEKTGDRRNAAHVATEVFADRGEGFSIAGIMPFTKIRRQR